MKSSTNKKKIEKLEQENLNFSKKAIQWHTNKEH